MRVCLSLSSARAAITLHDRETGRSRYIAIHRLIGFNGLTVSLVFRFSLSLSLILLAIGLRSKSLCYINKCIRIRYTVCVYYYNANCIVRDFLPLYSVITTIFFLNTPRVEYVLRTRTRRPVNITTAARRQSSSSSSYRYDPVQLQK